MFKKKRGTQVLVSSHIQLHPLEVHREAGRDPLLSSPQAGSSFMEVNEDTLLAVQEIDRTGSLQVVAERLELTEAGAQDLVELVIVLDKSGLVQSIDGTPRPSIDPRRRHKLLYAVPSRYLSWMHGPTIVLVIAGMVGLWLAAAYRDPYIIPNARDLPTDNQFFGKTIEFLVLSLLFSYVHELAHFFMARSFGLEPTIGFTNRFIILILHTDVTRSLVRPLRERMAILLAGVGLNLIIAIACALLVFGINWGLLPIPHVWMFHLRFLVVVNLLPIAGQLLIFARTDLYHIICAFTSVRDLKSDSASYLRFLASRLWKRIRREPTSACPACAARTLAKDPFCVRCGLSLPVADPNKYPFEFRHRRTLLMAGFAFILVTLYSYWLLAPMFLTLEQRIIVHSQPAVGAVWAAIHGGATKRSLPKALLTLFGVGLQFAYVIYMAGSKIWRKLLRPIHRFLARRRSRQLGGIAVTTESGLIQGDRLVASDTPPPPGS